eukprot:COSAG06_NODE_45486_length_354_cov_1.035294_1_plen_24_part_10
MRGVSLSVRAIVIPWEGLQYRSAT